MERRVPRVKRLLAAIALLALTLPAIGAEMPAATRNGREIYKAFHDGLADPSCDQDGSSARWRKHFANAPHRLAARDDDVLALFGYVVDALREMHLPTEYALIPFVESGYKPGARSPGGPAGLWQMIAVTARNHSVPIRAGYDGRLSPIDSTKAAVRYLKTLHGMFAGDWRLAVMAYNAGEYRVFGALKRSGQVARSAHPDKLVGLSGITVAYVRKLHALSCLFDQADDREDWLHALDRPVPVLSAVPLPADAGSLDRWSRDNGLDAGRVRRLNPAFVDGRIARADRALRVLVPATSPPAVGAVAETGQKTPAQEVSFETTIPATTPADAPAIATPHTHTVSRGESAWKIAHHYRLSLAQLLARNGLDTRSRLQPGMVLKLDADAGE
ncbi:MAG: transglycosylase SLT domain-containing protein [Luteimonas sp.]